MKDSIYAHGIYQFEAFHRDGARAPEYDATISNVVTQGWYTAVMKFMNQALSNPGISDLNLTHMAFGTGTTAALRSDISLSVEGFRKALSSKSFKGSKFTCKLALATSEANFTITEVGVFANGSDTAGSGTLISRCNVNIEKNANIKYLVTYTMELV